MIHPFSASYECGCRLAAAGIPLDYLKSLPREVDAVRSHLCIRQLGGYSESRVLDLRDGGIRYLIALRVATNLSRGIVISDWSITTPWDHHISWDYNATDIVPASDHPAYARLLNSPLSGVLNGQRRLSRGRAIDGLLCGCAFFQSIPESTPNGATVHVNLSLTDDTGQVFSQDIGMVVDRWAVRRFEYVKREGRLLDKRDSVAKEKRQAPPRPRPIRRRQLREEMRRFLRSLSTSGCRVGSKRASATGGETVASARGNVSGRGHIRR